MCGGHTPFPFHWLVTWGGHVALSYPDPGVLVGSGWSRLVHSPSLPEKCYGVALQPWLAAHQHISADGIGNQSSIEQAVAHHSHSHSWRGVLGVGGISLGTEGYWAGLCLPW